MKLTYVECPRDSWQGIKGFIPTEKKIEYIKKLIEAGFINLDCASFVSAKAIPQMKDSEEVLNNLPNNKNINYLGIIANEKGLERALSARNLTSIGYPLSISDTFQRHNTNRSLNDSWSLVKAMKKEVLDKRFVVYLSMGFGNPYKDPWNEVIVLKSIEKLLNFGIKHIAIADTLGQATQEIIEKVSKEVTEHFSGEQIGVHLHAKPEMALSLVTTAWKNGITWFEGALGGVGGCPFAADELVGNVPTELVLPKLEEMAGKTVFNKTILDDLAKDARFIKENYDLIER